MKLFLLGLALFTASAGAADYRWLNSWDRNLVMVPQYAEPYQKAVEKASNGSIKFVISGPEAVPPFEQLQPVASGAFQFLFTNGAYHFGTTPLMLAFEALGGTPEQRRTSGVLDYLDRHYQKLGLKLVSMAMTRDGHYQLILKKPLTAAGDLAGHKIRGNPAYQSVVKMLGGSIVNLPFGEVYTALDKGVVDGFAAVGIGITQTKLYEVSKYVVRPAFGFNCQAVLANLNTWNKLTAAERKILLDEGAKADARWLELSTQLMAEDERSLVANGMQVVHMGEAQKAKLKAAWSEGIWEMAAQKHKKEVEEFRAFARSKGL